MKTRTRFTNLAPEPSAPVVVPAPPPRRRMTLMIAVSTAVLSVIATLLILRPWDQAPRAQELAAPRSAGGMIAVTGTGPGLAWVADQQRAWARHAVTGTGPDLAFLARLQVPAPVSVTGTGDDLQRIADQPDRDAVAMIGSP
jgi:hypothetical protein